MTSTSTNELSSHSATARTSATVIVPTYREAANVSRLIERLAAVREESNLRLDLLIVDDNSNDGTKQIIADQACPWVRLIVRRKDRGLSQSVIEGLNQATGDYVVVMDADLSHPPEAIPDMLRRLDDGDQFVIGSRYVRGGTTDATWGVYRYLNSKAATLLARPFTRAKDPMAGFFAFRRDALTTAAPLNPIGYKIGLELIVKCRFDQIGEVPIHFADRTAGESKLNFTEQLRYIQHVRRLFVWKYPNWSYIVQFAAVGGSGLIVNLAVLTLLVSAGVHVPFAVGVAIGVAMFSNFLLNRRFTFSYAKDGPFMKQLAAFVGACSFGAAVNYIVTIAVLGVAPTLPVQIAATMGVLAGMTINFLSNRYITFRKKKMAMSHENSNR
jgi:dolichol-phosphate mannosyltransferase